MSVCSIYIGSDHAGFDLKQEIVQRLRAEFPKVNVIDHGCASTESVDYPAYAQKVAQSVAQETNSRGILICGTGIGMCIAANKVRGIRAASIWNLESAQLCREHNDCNVICLAGRFLKPNEAWSFILQFIKTSFLGGRHLQRIKMIDDLEKPE
ncbi:ribose 5-phosphate isomerase B [bacterium]|nr:ribose 5-phosphate isomerase B [bacterium]NBX82880.1 ribose 5-phosphate isomerase B [bacterium]